LLEGWFNPPIVLMGDVITGWRAQLAFPRRADRNPFWRHDLCDQHGAHFIRARQDSRTLWATDPVQSVCP